MASPETTFIDWRKQASSELQDICGATADQVWQGEWHFNWYESWVAGCTPHDAAQDAYCELDDRGLMGQDLEPLVLVELARPVCSTDLIRRGFLADVEREVSRATAKYPPFNSAHEGYAVLLEEVDELWAEVKRKQSERDQDALITEVLHVAAMATRFAVEIAITNYDK